MRGISVAICCLASAMGAQAGDRAGSRGSPAPQGAVQSRVVVAANCWVEAERRYGIDAWLLYSIAVRESSLNPRAFNRNKDGSYDISLMQVNSKHLAKLATFGIREEHLWNPCFNIQVGAWILADSIRQFGPTWNAVGAYNAGNQRSKDRDALRDDYARSVMRIYRRHVRLRD